MAFLTTHATGSASVIPAGVDRAAGAAAEAQGGRFELSQAETSIGRHPDCHIVVDAGAVSRFHAQIVREGDNFRLVDLGSRNGTFLNGQAIDGSQPLRQGDRIRISEIELVFNDDQVPEFASDASNVSFSGANFGIVMVDDDPESSVVQAKNAAGVSGSVSSQVEFEKSSEGLKMRATAEAKLNALLTINRNLSNTLSLDEVLPRILDSLFTIFPSADRGFVVMETPEGELETRWVKTRQSRDETETVRISRTIIRRVMSTGESIMSFDAMEDSRFDSSESIADFSIKSMICAPLGDIDGKMFGAIQIDSTRGRGQFVEEDIDLLSGVAGQAGILINSARMHEQALTQREVEQDLKLAIEVQKAFLPQNPPDATGFAVESFYQAANHIGGDYFDYIHLADGRIAIVVADVVGHGVAAAMFMAKLSAETRFCLAGIPDVAKAIEKLNDRMSVLEVERFITFLLVVIDPSSDLVTIVNAGHMAPILRRVDGQLSEPGEEESGLPIAIDTGMDYEAVEVEFAPGDVMLMYTDGINEAMDASDNEFGIEAIRNLTNQGGNCDEIKTRVVDAVLKHVGDAPPFDDMCMVVIQRTGQSTASESASTEKRLVNDTVDEDLIGSAIK